MFDPVSEFSRPDEVQRRRPMQTDPQEPIETGKMIHMSMQYERMGDTEELARRK